MAAKNSMPVVISRVALLVILASGVALLIVGCSDGAGQYVHNAQGTLIFVTLTPPPPVAVTPRAAGAADALYWSQKTAEAAVIVLTDDALSTVSANQATQASVQLTNVEFDRQMRSAAATSTEAMAQTAVAWTQESVVATQDMAKTQDAAAAILKTETAQTQAVAAAQTASASSTQAAASITATAVKTTIQAQTDMVTTWGPIFLIIALCTTGLVFAWRAMRIYEVRQRLVKQPNGASMLLEDQRANVEQYLPKFLRWLAWFLETRTVLVDPERALGPAMVIHGGNVTSPQLTDPDRQERVTGRRQLTQLAHAMASDGDPDLEQGVPLTGSPALPGGPTALGDVVDGEYRIVPPDSLQGWISEVRHKLPGGPEEGGE